jgi:hypothetical protein
LSFFPQYLQNADLVDMLLPQYLQNPVLEFGRVGPGIDVLEMLGSRKKNTRPHDMHACVPRGFSAEHQGHLMDLPLDSVADDRMSVLCSVAFLAKFFL